MGELQDRVAHLIKAIEVTPRAGEQQAQRARAIDEQLDQINIELNGDSTISRRYKQVPISINGRVGSIMFGQWDSWADITQTNKDSYQIAVDAFAGVKARLRQIDGQLDELEQTLDQLGAPWTPGRL